MRDNLTYRTARSHVHTFSSEMEELLARHVEAMECLDCERYLQLGIEAFEWLARAEADYNRKTSSETASHEPDVEATIKALYRQWFRTCQGALDRVNVFLAR